MKGIFFLNNKKSGGSSCYQRFSCSIMPSGILIFSIFLLLCPWWDGFQIHMCCLVAAGGCSNRQWKRRATGPFPYQEAFRGTLTDISLAMPQSHGKLSCKGAWEARISLFERLLSARKGFEGYELGSGGANKFCLQPFPRKPKCIQSRFPWQLSL